MSKKHIYYFLLVLLLADLTYSFAQHYSMPLDGDMAGGIVPAEDVKQILNDPFGISVLTENAVYPNPNRYFAHWTFFTYFNSMPLLLQTIFRPIDSVYIACALAKIAIQVLILVLLSFYVTGKTKILNSNFLIAAVLIAPLFQVNGYRSYMGIIDPSITYTFFYALPCSLLLLFYFPFFSDAYYGTTLLKNRLLRIALVALTLFSVFNGALNPAIILTITFVYSLKCFVNTSNEVTIGKRIVLAYHSVPKTHLFFFSFASILSLYALLIGLNNAIFLGETIPLAERYARLPMGIITILTQKIGFLILLAAIGVNITLLRRTTQNNEIKKLLHLFNWIGLFSLLYILLLPLGGYKEYRPNSVRYDTIMPITIGLLFIYGMSSLELIKILHNRTRTMYFILLTAVAFIFLIADKPEFKKNACERLALEKISKSNDKVVFLEDNCTVLSWYKITDSTKSTLNGQLLEKWRITKDIKKYYQNE